MIFYQSNQEEKNPLKSEKELTEIESNGENEPQGDEESGKPR